MYLCRNRPFVHFSFFISAEIEVQLDNLGHCRSEVQHKRTIQSQQMARCKEQEGGKTRHNVLCV